MVLKRLSLIALPALALSLAACGTDSEDAADAGAESAAEASVIQQRQDNFEEIGDAFKAIRGQLEGGAPDFAAIAGDAGTINADAMKIEGFFPADTGISSGADTEALDVIWEKPEEFAAAAAKLVTTSETLLAAAAGEDLAAVQTAVKELGGSCKGCHDTFRLDED